ncbi:MAG: ribonuclease Z [Sphingobacteriales bacterium]|jgi:ribonuclease Z
MFAVTILGNNSALPMHDRHPTAQVVTYKDQCFLIDCGEGTQLQMNTFKIRKSRISHIFISHLHGDHYFGLFGLINSMGLNGRKEPLYIFGPAALKPLLHHIFEASETILPFPIHIHPILAEGLIWEGPAITISAFTVFHRIECWGFLFKEREKPRKINVEKVRAYDIPNAYLQQLKNGADYERKDGTLIPNEELTFPGTEPRSYAYCADTRFEPEKLCPILKDCSLLYHESTYLKSEHEKAIAHNHSTAEEAAIIAAQANAKRLIIGHFSSRYIDLNPFLEEAKAFFPKTDLAIEGTTYIVG